MVLRSEMVLCCGVTENKKELVDDLVKKAKQIEILIQSLPVPEPEETQVSPLRFNEYIFLSLDSVCDYYAYGTRIRYCDYKNSRRKCNKQMRNRSIRLSVRVRT